MRIHPASALSRQQAGTTSISCGTGKDGWPLATAVHFPDADAPLPAQHVNGFYLGARCKHEGRCVPLAQGVVGPA